MAEAAGVSITTVSHALNGKGRLPDATRDYVRAVAAQVGYTPSRQGRGLATGRTMLLGMQASGFKSRVLVPQLAYFVDLLNAGSTTALDRGYGLVLLPPDCPSDKVASLSFDGAAVVDPVGEESLLTILHEEGKPVVTTGRIPGEAASGTSVDTDHVAAAQVVLDHLAENGYPSPWLLTDAGGTPRPSYAVDVADGYRDWCRRRKVPPRTITVDDIPTEEAAEAAVERALEEHGFEVDCIFATLDVLAIGALKAAHKRHHKVPDDLAIAALTDSSLLRAASPPITALNLHPDTIGIRAVTLLIDLVEGKETTVTSDPVEATLVPRASTAGKKAGSSKP